MTDKLPPNLLALFAPRPPLRYLPPIDRAPDDIKKSNLEGVAGYVEELKKYGEEVPYHPTECWLQRKARLKAEKKERIEKLLTEGVKNCRSFPPRWHLCVLPSLITDVSHLDNPHADPNIRGDAYKTLFVARLSYEAKESDLEREFGRFGPIERVSNVALF